jgi:hypothetical protein
MRAGLAGGGARKVTLIAVGANAGWYQTGLRVTRPGRGVARIFDATLEHGLPEILAASSSPCLSATENSGCHDRNAPTGTKRQQIEVAGYDNVGFTVHGEFKKLVIFGIAAFSHGLGDRNEFSRRKKAAQPNRMERPDLFKQARASQDVKKLLFRRGGLQQPTKNFKPLNQDRRPGRLYQRGANEDVRIDDKPHLRPH